MYDVVYAKGVSDAVIRHKSGLFLSEAVQEARALAQGFAKEGEYFTVAVRDDENPRLIKRVWTDEDEEFKDAKS